MGKAGAKVEACLEVEGSLASVLSLATLEPFCSPHGLLMAKVWPPPFISSGSLVLSRSGEPTCPDRDAQCFAAFCPIKIGTQDTNHYLVSTSASAVNYAKPLPVLPLPLQTTAALSGWNRFH